MNQKLTRRGQFIVMVSAVTSRVTYLSCLLSVLLLTNGCATASHQPSLTWSDLSAQQASSEKHLSTARYTDEVKKWTRYGAFFESFEGKLFVQATCLSPTFEASRAQWHGERLALTSVEREAKKDQLITRSEQQLMFFVAIATQDQSFNDLRPRGSPLKAHLIMNGEVVEAKWITELNTQERLNAEVDFPYFTPLYRAYWVSFAVRSVSDELSLRVSGLRGTVQLTWAFDEPISAHAMLEDLQ